MSWEEDVGRGVRAEVGMTVQIACGKCRNPTFHVGCNRNKTLFILKCAKCGYSFGIRAEEVFNVKTEEIKVPVKGKGGE